MNTHIFTSSPFVSRFWNVLLQGDDNITSTPNILPLTHHRSRHYRELSSSDQKVPSQKTQCPSSLNHTNSTSRRRRECSQHSSWLSSPSSSIYPWPHAHPHNHHTLQAGKSQAFCNLRLHQKFPSPRLVSIESCEAGNRGQYCFSFFFSLFSSSVLYQTGNLTSQQLNMYRMLHLPVRPRHMRHISTMGRHRARSSM